MENQKIVIADVSISFSQMISLFFKAFPAFIIATALWWVLTAILVVTFGGMLAGLIGLAS